MAIPSGIILLWSGAVVDIPAGWLLCDGNFGTPDLTDRFVVGAGDTYDPEDTGGSTTHNHNFTSDGHIHVIPAGSNIVAGFDYNKQTESNADSGTTDNKFNLPPWFALAYIMKT